MTTGIDALCEIGVTTAGTYISRYFESIGFTNADIPKDTKLYLGSTRDIGDKLEVCVAFSCDVKDYKLTQTLDNGHGTVNGALKYMRLAVPKHKDSNGSYYTLKDVLFYQNDVDIMKAKFNKDKIVMDKLQYDSEDAAYHSAALGCNVNVLFKSLAGYTYEDSIVVSEGFMLRYGLAIVKSLFSIFTSVEKRGIIRATAFTNYQN